MKPHCHTGSGSTSHHDASSSARSRTRRVVSPASSGSLYSRIGTREVVRALGPQALGIDELEPTVAGVERVPAVGVAVHEHRRRRVERRRPLIAVGERRDRSPARSHGRPSSSHVVAM